MAKTIIMANNPIVLVVLDGFGLSSQMEGNAIRAAQTPHINSILKEYPWGPLEAAGMNVGVMWGEPGNSEVGHLGIGAGQVVYQSLPRIALSIEDKSFFQNAEFLAAIEHARSHTGALHLVGLTSSGGVHAHIEHLERLLELCHQQKFTNVVIHMITDGRDTPAQKALEFVDQIDRAITQYGCGRIATVTGRFYSMDRNTNWDRIQKGYDAMTQGRGECAASAKEAISQSYAKNIFDEEIIPTVITIDGSPVAVINDGDAVIFFNYREDRARQLTQAFVKPGFDGFTLGKTYAELYFVTMVEYEKGLPAHVAYPPQFVSMPLGKVIAHSGLKQLRLAETEKYAHVTYFFDGGNEEEYPGVTRVMIPSKKVDSYAKVPEMSAREITERLVKELTDGDYTFIIVNFANADMVGHTGDFDATVKAVEVIDECLGIVQETVLAKSGVMLITADHGNAEQKIDPTTGKSSKEHTANPVPFILIDASRKRQKPDEEVEAMLSNPTPIGLLADVAPTIIEMMGLEKPPEMTGNSLLQFLQ